MADDTKAVLQQVFADLHHLPFLFIGSGMSRRYLGLPDWEGLLRQFAEVMMPGNPLALEVFRREGSDSWPDVATRLEERFNQFWLTDKRYQKAREQFQEEVRGGESPFKLEVARFVASAKRTTDKQHLDELSVLKNVARRSVAGVITTNYDRFPEDVFSGYGVFIGQEELLFSGTQGVSEIYKVHGCCTRPDSIVINAADYATFNERNAYLAAKLLTVFVEHPIIFLGYSISDPNVKGILSAIAACLSPKNLGLLKRRLVFVEYSPDPLPTPVVRDHTINFGGADQSLEMTRIQLHDFKPLYVELLSRKFEYNPKMLRQLKRDIYQLITTNEPVDRFQVVDIEDDDLENVQVLAGVGIAGAGSAGEAGHHIPKAEALFRDIVFDDGGFDTKSLVEDALGLLLAHHSHSLPVHKYIAAYSEQGLGEAPEKVYRDAKYGLDAFLNNTYRKCRIKHTYGSVEELRIASSRDLVRIFEQIPCLDEKAMTVDALEELLYELFEAHPDALTEVTRGLKTHTKRVIKIYDWLKYGKGKGAPTT